jgi:ribonuclease HI
MNLMSEEINLKSDIIYIADQINGLKTKTWKKTSAKKQNAASVSNRESDYLF